ncbi:LGFP repeat-containing protein [Aquihabitans sp. McL0605]|uniref:LGFP repeat-containing protein n=1 Tax=Aquihabitans sp. McL0605 TaxID=3415671 RepID=UPI003CF88529
MTVALPRRSSRRPDALDAPVVEDLTHEGIHRDTANPDPLATATFSQRLVHRASGLFSKGTTRRSFLTRTAVLGSALAVGPIDFILKPGTAYAYTCGVCSDGWTAFCCTINSGKNSCPPNSFVAGWWKADNAAYCCGAARYIIDCNATCPTQCSCRCAGGSCDGRRTCCNQFRYGQCHTEIACYGPVVCRVATCTPPWQYDKSCTTSSATDNNTVNHGAPCIGTDCGTPIDKKYKALGGASGFLGAVTTPEQANSDGRGRVARYKGGNIYWTSTTGAHEVHGAILTEFGKQASVNGILKYPTSDTLTSGDKKSRYSNFENGRIYYRSGIGTFTVPAPFFKKHESLKGIYGVLGYPTANVRTSSDKLSRYQNYASGRIYSKDGSVVEVHGAVFTLHEKLGGVHGVLGYPLGDLVAQPDKRGKAQWFGGGFIWYTPTTGAHALWGKVNDRYLANGNAAGYLKYPTSDRQDVGDGRGTYATFEHGNIYASDTTDGFEVHGAILTAYLNTYGGPTGSLGYPTSEFDPAGTAGGRFQHFENGTLRYYSGGSVVLVP